MANVPYVLPDTRPDPGPPDDYQHQQASPQDFGAAIGQGIKEAGQGTTIAAQHFGEIQTDDVTNNTLTQGNDLITKLHSLRGQDALTQGPAIREQLAGLWKTGREQLGTNQQQLQYDRETRAWFERTWPSAINQHLDQQATEYGTTVNTATVDVNVNNAAMYPERVAEFAANASAATDRQSHLRSGQTTIDPAIIKAAREKETAKVYSAAAETIASRDGWHKALDFAKANESAFGASYGPMTERLRGIGHGVTVNGVAKDIIQESFGASGQVSGTIPAVSGIPRVTPIATDPGAKPGYTYNSSILGHEGTGTNITPYTDAKGTYHPHGTGASGGGFLQTTWDGIRKTHTELDLPPTAAAATSDQRNSALDALSNSNRSYLRAHDIVPTDKNTFMAHFLGAAGAVKFFDGARNNPAAPAAPYFPEEAAANKRDFYDLATGQPRSFGQLYAHMTQNFSGAISVPNVGGGIGFAPQGFGQVAKPSRVQMPEEEEIEPTTVQPPPSITPVSTTLPPPPGVETPEDKIEKLTLQRDNAISRTQMRTDLDPYDQIAVEKQIEAHFRGAMIAAQLDQQTHKARINALSSDIDKLVDAGNADQAFDKIHQSGLSPADVDILSKGVVARTGDEDPWRLGPKFSETNARLFLPPGDPNRIGYGDVTQVWALQGKGLNTNGVKTIIQRARDMYRDADESALQIRLKSGADAIHNDLVKEDIDPNTNRPFYSTFDQHGYNKFLQAYEASFAKWRKDGNDPNKWEYFDDKKLRGLAESIYPKAVRDKENLTKVELPEGVTSEKWVSFLGRTGEKDQASWANIAAKLVADPSKVEEFNNDPIAQKAGLRGDAILAELGVPYSGPKTSFETTVSNTRQQPPVTVAPSETPDLSLTPGFDVLGSKLQRLQELTQAARGTINKTTVDPHFVGQLLGLSPKETEMLGITPGAKELMSEINSFLGQKAAKLMEVYTQAKTEAKHRRESE